MSTSGGYHEYMWGSNLINPFIEGYHDTCGGAT